MMFWGLRGLGNVGMQYRFMLQTDVRDGERVNLAFQTEEEAGIWHKALQEAINAKSGDSVGSTVGSGTLEGNVQETPRMVRLKRPFRRNRSMTLSIDLGSPPAETPMGHPSSPVLFWTAPFFFVGGVS